MGFTRTSSRAANSRRKRRFPRETRQSDAALQRAQAERVVREREAREREQKIVNGLLHGWRSDLASGGTNNAISYAGMTTLTTRLHKMKRFTRAESVFADLGCGVGIPCIQVALRAGARAIGVEKDLALVDKARRNAQVAGVDDLCTFVCMDLNDLTPAWFAEHGVTHVMAFDAVFGEPTLGALYECIGRVKTPLVGTGTSVCWKHWADSMAQVGGPVSGIKLTGRGASTFSFRFWSK